MARKRFAIQVGLGGALLALLAGCSATTGSAATGSTTAPKNIVIGLSNQTMAGTFPVGLAKGAQEEAKKLGIKVVVLDSKGDVQKQGSDMQDLIAQQVNGILIVPNSPGPAQAMVDQAVAAKIPVASVHGTVGTGPTNVPYSKLSFTMNESADVLGKEETALAVKALPKGGKVAIITGAAGFLENTTWTAGFKSGLAAKGGFTIVATQPGNWTPEAGQAACQGILSAHPDVDLFYAISDDMATGCAKAVAAANSKAKVLGNGGSAAGIAGIKDGSIYGDVCYKPVDEGAKAVNTLYQQITGKTAASHKVLSYDTPAITLDNIDQCVAQW
ncbi:MAG: ribose transport system substrate-binding protein [Microbacteriaceae bacterium]|jgi:ribose transport system substrate-binding protein|nr:ribose transport system substrate-binding protein [Microbacteriaceae bacterium]